MSRTRLYTLIVATAFVAILITYKVSSSYPDGHFQIYRFWKVNKDDLIKIQSELNSYLETESRDRFKLGCNIEKQRCTLIDENRPLVPQFNQIFLKRDGGFAIPGKTTEFGRQIVSSSLVYDTRKRENDCDFSDLKDQMEKRRVCHYLLSEHWYIEYIFSEKSQIPKTIIDNLKL